MRLLLSLFGLFLISGCVHAKEYRKEVEIKPGYSVVSAGTVVTAPFSKEVTQFGSWGVLEEEEVIYIWPIRESTGAIGGSGFVQTNLGPAIVGGVIGAHPPEGDDFHLQARGTATGGVAAPVVSPRIEGSRVDNNVDSTVSPRIDNRSGAGVKNHTDVKVDQDNHQGVKIDNSRPPPRREFKHPPYNRNRK